MNEHKNKKNREKPVAAQFCQLDHIMEDLQVRGIKTTIQTKVATAH